MEQDEPKGLTKPAHDEVRQVLEDLRDGLATLVVTGGEPVVAGSVVLAKSLGRSVFRYLGASYSFDADKCCDLLCRELAARLQEAGGDDTRARDILDEYLPDPKRARTLRKGFQQMTDVTVTAAWPCIAALVADYWADGKAVDGFFKEAASVFGECVGDDLVALETVLALAQSLWPEVEGAQQLELNYNPPPRSDLTVTDPSKLENRKVRVSINVDPRRALRLLTDHYFSVGGREQLHIRREAAEDCWRLLKYAKLREQG